MKNLIKGVDWINRIMEAIVVVLLFAAFLATFMQVIFRNWIKISLPWTDEFSRYCIIYVVYLSAGVAARRGKLIRMDVVPLLAKFSEKQTQIMYWIANFISIAYTVIVVVATHAILPANVNKMSASLNVPMSNFYYALPVGAVWLIINMFVYSIDQTIRLKEAAGKGAEK